MGSPWYRYDQVPFGNKTPDMYIYIYIYMYQMISVYVYVCMYIYIYIHIYIYIYVSQVDDVSPSCVWTPEVFPREHQRPYCNVPRKDLAPDLCELKRRLGHWTTQRWCENSYWKWLFIAVFPWKLWCFLILHRYMILVYQGVSDTKASIQPMFFNGYIIWYGLCLGLSHCFLWENSSYAGPARRPQKLAFSIIDISNQSLGTQTLDALYMPHKTSIS